jgi:hypothetical protein
MTPEPRFFETLIAKKERRAIEAKAAWREHKATQLAVDMNMARLREIRLAGEAPTVAPSAGPRVERLRKRAKNGVTSHD